jgi:hypothetical protein
MNRSRAGIGWAAIAAPLALAAAVIAASCGSTSAPVVIEALVIETDSIPRAWRGITYVEAVQAAGGDGAYDWAVSAGALPPGIVLTVDDLGDDGAILAGIPEAEGDFGFTLRVTSGDGQTASRAFTLVVRPPPPPTRVMTPAIPPVMEGGAYDVRLRAQGGDGSNYTWQLIEGSLPAGLELTAAGRIFGTATTPDTARFTVEVQSVGPPGQRSFTLPVVPRRADGFMITIFPITPLSDAMASHVAQAVAQWEAAITQDLLPVTIPHQFFMPDECFGWGSLANGTTVDDLLILLNIEPIDGPGRVLGRAGICGLRGTDHPFVGMMTLDLDDLDPLTGTATLTYILSHEIGHVLGFGTLWGRLNLKEGAGTANPVFTGPAAIAEYEALGGSGGVPLETEGGMATREAHWRETVFGIERMTGFSEPVGVHQPLSRVSIASIGDLGYDIDLSAADAYSLGSSLIAGGTGAPHSWGGLGYDEVLMGPVRIMEADGRSRVVELQVGEPGSRHDHR